MNANPGFDLDPDFDENWYLTIYSDVARAVAAKTYASGWAHYAAYGRAEGRLARPPGGRMPVAVAASSSDGPGMTELLLSRTWRLFRPNGDVRSQRIRFLEGGVIAGYSHDNEAFWEVISNRLVFRHSLGGVTALSADLEPTGQGLIRFKMKRAENPAVDAHILEERDRPLADFDLGSLAAIHHSIKAHAGFACDGRIGEAGFAMPRLADFEVIEVGVQSRARLAEAGIAVQGDAGAYNVIVLDRAMPQLDLAVDFAGNANNYLIFDRGSRLAGMIRFTGNANIVVVGADHASARLSALFRRDREGLFLGSAGLSDDKFVAAAALLSPEEFVRQFQATPEAQRAAFIADQAGAMGDTLSGLPRMLSLVDYDAAAFHRGLSQALADNPKNITAGRSLALYLVRIGEFAEAKKILRDLAVHWPDHGDLFFKDLRLLILENSPERVEVFEGLGRYFSKLARRMSYKLQIFAGIAKADLKGDLAVFDAVCKAALFDLLRGPEAGGAPGLNATETDLLWQAAKRILAAGTIAIVGNAPNLRGGGKGVEIDAHDLVFRCNFPALDGHEQDVGAKVDLVFFNESIRYRVPALRQRSGRYDGVIGIGMHTDTGFGFHPDGGMAPEVAFTTSLPPGLRQFIQNVCYAGATTGLMAIVITCLIFGKRPSIYGFDFFKDPAQAHYYDAQTGAFLGHELQYERWYVDRFLSKVCGYEIVVN